ncbi:hypothetical protein QMZ62_06320 [Serratia sp. PF2-63]|uniref:hypothetical protein n=1 Tax=unclassified Serratia (in: enterobacteria) TaxID=2647522 RepID=UPI0024AF5BAA|nr:MULTISPECIES: hypothetical protein [unclassified Serratia (in: enterobacteria)]EMB6252941.1 hypothetical protein [Serratia marcescens]MDI6936370.1 hypothetical protein [Serratia sp. Se-PFBMAAmG]MDI6974294.1 hypothetical protein [Serratia sp. Se-RSBMAAmG]MDI9262574.1 hypothetical protein [Serratia sp. PF2-63]MDI9270921.1 hypothetical protein [Serratia sp. PF-27]
MTANAFAPFLGMWNYLKADGAPLSLDVTSIGLTFNRDILTPVSFALNNNPPGQYPISGNFGKSMFDDICQPLYGGWAGSWQTVVTR